MEKYLSLIYQFVDYREAIRHFVVSHSWFIHLSDHNLWRYYIRRELHITQNEQALSPSSVKRLFLTNKKWRDGKYVITSLETMHESGVTCCELYNNTVISGAKDHLIVQWDSRRGVVLKCLTGHINEIVALRVVNGTTLVSCCGSKTATTNDIHNSLILVWDIATGTMLRKIILDGVASDMIATESHIIVSLDSYLIIFSFEEGVKLYELKKHEQAISRIKLFNHSIVLSASYDEKVHCWNFKTGELLHSLECNEAITCMDVVPSHMIAIGLYNGSVQIWNKNFQLIAEHSIHTRSVSTICCSTSGNCVISASHKTLTIQQNISNLGTTLYKIEELETSIAVVTCMKCDDSKLVVGYSDATIKVFDLISKRRLYTIDEHLNRINSVQFSGEMLVAASNDATLSVYDFSPDDLEFMTVTKEQKFNLLLVDINNEVCEELTKVFHEHCLVKVLNASIEDIISYDCIVSPANSFGLMDGGVDSVITKIYGTQLHNRVQQYILDEYQGEQPVGTAFIIPAGKDNKFLAHCPTMRVPMDIRNTDYVYLAMKALLREVHKFNRRHDNQIKTVVCPGFGTLTGLVSPAEAARQMELAYRNFMQVPAKITWEFARQRQKAIRFGGNGNEEFRNINRVV
jgi:WD40 repeat protein